MLSSAADLEDYAAQRQWSVSGGTVRFCNDGEKMLQLPSTQLIQETLSYAKELERIV